MLVFARPQAGPPRPLCLNEVAGAMHDLLSRLLGENVKLELQMDSELGAVNIDLAQAQQILLNLVLNARDALPEGGRITVETRNCKFQPMAGAPMTEGLPLFPAFCWPWRITAEAWMQKHGDGCLSRFSRPRMPGRERGWD